MPMKLVALFALIITLGVSLFGNIGASVTNNTVAIAVMILLLAVFSDLKEFNFWGLSGKKKEEIQKLEKTTIINEETDIKPSAYKLRKATREDSPEQMSSLKDTFLALSYEIERLLRIIARSIARSTEETAQFTPEDILEYLEDQELLTPEACEAIEGIREIRKLITEERERIDVSTLESILKVSQTVYSQLREWLENATK
jgi:uncharacterized protein YutE (UPF0331/DUF86 family)